ncbi:microfibril-associated glycoprotein 4-like [Saccostrea cucullata]|uniref:microfibril-associated glycoprotein 4-like n=1 Tax=Saccostrea cuccullata TaxID=36930 RepID=UPI002ED194ED
MISLYFIGQFLGLLHAGYSQCLSFDPKTLIISNIENSSVPGFHILTNTDIGMCMIVCNRFLLCRSVDWIREEKKCRLNTRFASRNVSDFMTKGRSIHVDRGHFPRHLVGNCLNPTCTEDAICINGECVQVLKEKIYKDCSDILKKDPNKIEQDGVYVIYPDIRREVFCDMTTDGGGWTVIQKREDGDGDFYRTWEEFKRGFGNVSKNYWIGNDAIHTLTKDKNQELRVDLQSHDGEEAHAVYTTFYIEDEGNKYTLTVSGYSGTAGDSFTYHNGMGFSTKDQDNDSWSNNCAVVNHGAWWYTYCYDSNLNGEYAQRNVTGDQYMTWHHWKEKEALRKTVLMIRNND